jgi:hypothetical protein
VMPLWEIHSRPGVLTEGLRLTATRNAAMRQPRSSAVRRVAAELTAKQIGACLESLLR